MRAVVCLGRDKLDLTNAVDEVKRQDTILSLIGDHTEDTSWLGAEYQVLEVKLVNYLESGLVEY